MSKPRSTKTSGVAQLGRYARIVKPYSNDVTLDVFLEIERDEEFLSRYNVEVGRLRKQATVNSAIGRYVRDMTGRRTGPPVQQHSSNLVGYYCKMLP